MRTHWILATAVACCMAMPALAQPPGGGGGGRGGQMMQRGGGGAMLLTNASVQEELKLSDEQKEKVKTLSKEMQDKMQEAMKDLQDVPQDERREKMQAMTKEHNEKVQKAIKEVLKPEQVKRFQQIQWQQAGLGVFNDAEVKKTLKITDEQADKFKAMGEEMRKDMQELFQGGGNPRESQDKIAALRKEAMKKAEDVLTAEQKTQWKEMVGAHFEVKQEARTGGNRPRRDP